MRTTTAVTVGWWPRLLLLVCTLLGLAAMHTIGHGGHAGADRPAGHRAAGATPAVAAHHDGPRPVPAAMPLGDAARLPAAASGLMPAGALPAAPSDEGPAVWSACLAVLGGLGVTLLLAVRLRRRPGRRPRAATGHDGEPRPRGPPRRPVGLRFATVSVLRR